MSYNIEWDEFTSKSRHLSWWRESHVYPFHGASYSPYFIKSILDMYYKEGVLDQKPVHVLPQEESPFNLLEKMYQSFLGEGLIYFLGDLSYLFRDSKQQKYCSEILNYQGPHILIFFINKECHLPRIENIKKIIVPESSDEHFFYQLITFFRRDQLLKKKELIQNFFEQSIRLNMDQSLLLMDYLEVTALHAGVEFKNLCKKLFYEESSLFKLSQFFFAKKERDFFVHWKELAPNYPLMFWINFWSDQVWRSYFVVYFMKQKKMREARSMSNRLPFVFLKSLWKYADEKELISAYSFLYKMDYAAKNGSHFSSLEVFFTSYFSNDFKVEKEGKNRKVLPY